MSNSFRIASIAAAMTHAVFAISIASDQNNSDDECIFCDQNNSDDECIFAISIASDQNDSDDECIFSADATRSQPDDVQSPTMAIPTVSESQHGTMASHPPLANRDFSKHIDDIKKMVARIVSDPVPMAEFGRRKIWRTKFSGI